jgi:hypothetical protein
MGPYLDLLLTEQRRAFVFSETTLDPEGFLEPH